MAIETKKRYLYKIYNSAGTYLTTWNDVVDKPSFNRQINGGAGELVVKRAVDVFSYGETTNVALGNQLKLYVFDKDNLPDGTLIYTGELTRYTPTIEGKNQYVEITFLGYLQHLSRTILRGDFGRTSIPYSSYDPSIITKSVINNYRFAWGKTVSQSSTTGAGDGGWGKTNYYAQKFTTSATASENLLAGISMKIKYNTGTPASIKVDIRLNDGSTPTKPSTTILCTKTISALATTDTTYSWVDVIFDEPYQLAASSSYWIVYSSDSSSATNTYQMQYASGTNPYAGGYLSYSTDSGTTWTNSANDDYCFKTYYINTTPKINYKDWEIRHDWNIIESPIRIIDGMGAADWRAQSFTPSTNDTIYSAKIILIYNTGTPADITVNIETDNANKPSGTLVSAGATGTIPAFTDTTQRLREVVFNTIVNVASGTKYWLVIKSPSSSAVNTYFIRLNDNVSTHAGSHGDSTDSGATWAIYTNYDINFILYRSAPSIDYTATTVSYTFNTNNVKDALDKCLELCPYNWYWYLDVDNIVHLHAKSSTANHTWKIGNEIQMVEFENRSENIINRIYLRGGGVTPIYSDYEDATSITTYGLHEDVKVDERITVQASLDIVGATIINAYKDPEIRTIIRILDGNFLDTNLGYDIESIEVGDTFYAKGLVRNVMTKFDSAIFDTDVFDGILSSITATLMTVMSIDYYPDYIEINAQNKMPDINRRIEDVARNLINDQTVDNPARPS